MVKKANVEKKKIASQYIRKRDLCNNSKHETLTQCWFDAGQARRRWPSIKPALVGRLVFAQKKGRCDDQHNDNRSMDPSRQ